MTDTLSIPFMAVKGKPPLHLRDLTPEEIEQYQRMLRDAEKRARLAGVNTRLAREEPAK